MNGTVLITIVKSKFEIDEACSTSTFDDLSTLHVCAGVSTTPMVASTGVRYTRLTRTRDQEAVVRTQCRLVAPPSLDAAYVQHIPRELNHQADGVANSAHARGTMILKVCHRYLLDSGRVWRWY